MQQYNELCLELSSIITQRYSTSFTKGIQTLHKRFHLPIYAIYGFVRVADEIVDTFHGFDKQMLLDEFKQDTWNAIRNGISTNPVLQAFQLTVNKYKIDDELTEAFLYSMTLDLDKKDYDEAFYNKYIYGSAEVVGLMCLRVFCEGDSKLYDSLVEPARKLGAAFQKVNFLRDLKSDFQERGRVYFPSVDFNKFSEAEKKAIEADIQADFDAAFGGIMRLPKGVREGVYAAYVYYLELLRRIEKEPASRVMQMRIRVPDWLKAILLAKAQLKMMYSS
ncbi:MAG: phytoene/squalene synthase family protein [Bacteroidota bacterium]|jgi:phytoene/squalene synthetase